MPGKRARILLVVGTRPEAIKVAPVFNELRRRSERFQPVLCATGQHEEMLESVLRVFGIEPAWRLGLLKRKLSLLMMASALLADLDGVMREFRPEWVLCQGDTTSAMCAALAAFYAGIPVGHIEAGLRTYDVAQPYPEEANRRVISPMARLHFAPTELARQNLLAERIPEGWIHVTGNTVVDAIREVAPLSANHPGSRELRHWYAQNIGDRRCILVTGHRRENWGEGLRNVFSALRLVVDSHPDTAAIFPVHPNPLVQSIANDTLGHQGRIHLIPPQDYLSFAWLLSQCHVVLTDSGGIQEEAPGLGKPVLVFRNVTERPEGVEAGVVRLVGTDPACVSAALSQLLENSVAYATMAESTSPYGDGRASARIVDVLQRV